MIPKNMNFKTYRSRRILIKKIIFWSILIGGLLALFFVQTKASVSTYAVDQSSYSSIDPCTFGCLPGINRTDYSGVEGIIRAVLDVVYFLLYVGTAITVLFMVLGAYRMITSNGDDGAYKKGRDQVVNAAIGLIVAFISLTIVTIISLIVPNLNIF